jgi:hypothetical protein
LAPKVNIELLGDRHPQRIDDAVENSVLQGLP